VVSVPPLRVLPLRVLPLRVVPLRVLPLRVAPLRVLPLRVTAAPGPAAPGPAAPGPAATPVAAPPVATPAALASPTWNVLWRSGALSERDLNIPTGSNTAVTGSMLFKQGRWPHIDQRHYFRDEVFGDLDWTPDSRPSRAHLERARAEFNIIVNGVDRGDAHTTIDAQQRHHKQSL
jgi:hypothetical protein